MNVTKENVIFEMIRIAFIEPSMKSIEQKQDGVKIEYYETKKTIKSLYSIFEAKTETQLLTSIIKYLLEKNIQLVKEDSEKHSIK
jgi:hypothetical protein